MNRRDLIDYEYAHQLLNYDPDTGELTWNMQRPGITSGERAGTVYKKRYIRVYINNVRYSAHHLAWLMTYGEWPAGKIYHINGDVRDNRISNLSVPAPATGVYRKRNKWCVRIAINGHRQHLGYFNHLWDAVRARKVARNEPDQTPPCHGCAWRIMDCFNDPTNPIGCSAWRVYVR